MAETTEKSESPRVTGNTQVAVEEDPTRRAILNVMADLPAVPLGHTAGGGDTGKKQFHFRSIHDLPPVIQPLLDKHGLLMTPAEVKNFNASIVESVTRGGRPMQEVLVTGTVQFHLQSVQAGAERVTIEVAASGCDTRDKATGSMNSYAQKEAYVKAFHIRVADARDNEVKLDPLQFPPEWVTAAGWMHKPDHDTARGRLTSTIKDFKVWTEELAVQHGDTLAETTMNEARDLLVEHGVAERSVDPDGVESDAIRLFAQIQRIGYERAMAALDALRKSHEPF